MKHFPASAAILAAFVCLSMDVSADPIYNNLTPNNAIGVASRPSSGSPFEIESADDFVLSSQTILTSAAFTGLIVPGNSGTPAVSQVSVEIYQIFPLSSDTVRTQSVPTRVNSPSDIALSSRDSAASGLSFATTVLNTSFTALNSVAPGGVHALPNQRTGGNGPVQGQEVQFDLTFATPIELTAGHYFFVVQVGLTNGGTFYWLSASSPISGAGTTAFSPDLQAWTRDENLAPDWLRVGTDIIGGGTPPTYNMAFSLDGTAAVPEPATLPLTMASGAVLLAAAKRMNRRRRFE